MGRARTVGLSALGGLVGAMVIGPLLVPLPPLPDTLPPDQLADPDSRFLDLDGLCVHWKERGSGEPAMVLLHGFGASVFSWRDVLDPLAVQGRVIAFDRPGFGLTSRPMPGEWHGLSPYHPTAHADQTIAFLDALGIERAVLIGHSVGGTTALLAALRHPTRVTALVLESTTVQSAVPPSLLPLLRSPQMRRIGPVLVRRLGAQATAALREAWHDRSRLTPDIIAGYETPLRARNWDRALWELALNNDFGDLPTRIGEITAPTLLISGDSDTRVPLRESEELAAQLPHAVLTVIPECGHVPHEEQPMPFLHAVIGFLRGIDDSQRHPSRMA
jgi:pimeloyl-ACP methyl ester carboxylesterase